MGHMRSLIDKVASTIYEAPPSSRVAKAKRVYREGEFVLVEMENGTYFSCRSRNVNKNFSFPATIDEHHLVRALKAFGKINKEEMQAHIKYVDEECEKRALGYAADELKDLAKKYNFKITVEQKKKLGIEDENNS